MTSERIITNIRGWNESNQESIDYRRGRINTLVKEIAGLQTEIDEIEKKIKENTEAIVKLSEGGDGK